MPVALGYDEIRARSAVLEGSYENSDDSFRVRRAFRG